MSLPDLAWQIAYGRLAWAIVVAAMLVALWPAARRLPRGVLAAVLAASALSMALPGEASPAYWLGLGFQYPSGMLVGLCLLGLRARWQGEAAGAQAGAQSVDFMPLSVAAAIAIAGTALYLDAIGWLSQGYYYAGFGPVGAPTVALIGTAGCALALLRGRGSRQNGALLGALLLFTLLRLPSGNLWDAVLDPLLWGWALVTLARAALRRLAGAPALGKAAPIEQFSISKE
ncbi:hypothetical protein [Massilia niabensis]|uniref:Uncharacterized protein n=1 Tax=Massilia niabensis TaxID=544910 RepID=A0ABW0L271_9BURK